jgi:hypothetical protein
VVLRFTVNVNRNLIIGGFCLQRPLFPVSCLSSKVSLSLFSYRLLTDVCLVEPGLLAKHTWTDIAHLALNDDRPFQELSAVDIVPTTYTDICDWAIVCHNPSSRDYTRKQHVIYKHLDDPGSSTVYPVTIRFQGFLESFELGPLGSWKGWAHSHCLVLLILTICRNPRDAAAATQYLRLDGRDNIDAWISSLNAVRNVRQFIHNSISSGKRYVEPPIDARHLLYFHRRVFTKVRFPVDILPYHLPIYLPGSR